MLTDAATTARPLGHPEAARGTTSRSTRYGADRRPRPVALTAATVLVGSMVALSALFAFNSIATKKPPHPPILVDLLPEPSPPPPSPPEQKPVKVAQLPSPLVAPRALVPTPTPPMQIATSTEPPPPEVSLPGPPTPAAPSAPPAVESVGDLSASMIEATPPRYPIECRRRHEQGTVTLAVVLGLDGRVADIRISRSSGFERLDRAALAAVRRWRWSPTRRSGTAVMVRGLVEIPFILES